MLTENHLVELMLEEGTVTEDEVQEFVWRQQFGEMIGGARAMAVAFSLTSVSAASAAQCFQRMAAAWGSLGATRRQLLYTLWKEPSA